ncbi:shikimate kinase [Bacteroidota bacterium]
MIVFLIGFMGSGKSTAGKQLALRLGYSFVDTDQLIVEKFGMTINEIFDSLGEEAFREGEASLLNELISKRDLVVSTGGGLPCYGDNMDVINNNGISVYLRLVPDALFNRLVFRKYKRPLIRDLSDEELRAFINEKLAEREPFYNKARHILDGLKVNAGELEKLVRG